MSINREKLRQHFQEEYQKLNAQQQLAVDTTEGPVMVIAGPGTGKTQILAARIGKILLETDVSPDNILCLTYTDAGAIAMRDFTVMRTWLRRCYCRGNLVASRAGGLPL